MFDTAITMCGNVLTAPEWRRTANTGTYVMTFRFASTSRRFDRSTGQWIDGDSLRVKVACWRTLGQNAFESIQLGDPLVVYGRLYSRDWVDSDNNKRTSYELDAISVGHDLARGVARFLRRKPAGATDVVDDDEGRSAIGGEASEHVDVPGRPAGMPTVAQLFGEVDREQFVDPAASVGNEPVGGEDADDDEEADEIADLEGELTVAA
jgi:single-strand DNA-binding protein